MAVTVSIVAFSLETLAAEEQSAGALAAVLGVAKPTDWPPEFNDAESRAWFRKLLSADPAAKDWLGGYVIAEIDGAPTVLGTAGYLGPPDADGQVEIGYSIVAAYRRRGIGTLAVGLLVDRAFADPRVRRVTAETPAHFAASRRLLEKCGFVLNGSRTDADDGDLVTYAVQRPAA